ncbi:MAG: BMC domain-containing protein [Lachnospiraceae bacterium]|jgi:microcompartment protein CcmL/EutN|nr:BMC domain-containing protein [Lachnospiraceae bacterium]MCI1727297.1 BMC domain-containing protein [Lachnospiraceae bacterium]
MVETIGFLETTSIAKGVEAADALLKAAEVRLLFAKPICPGKYIVLFCGDVAAVKSSLEAGVRIAKDTVVDTVVIPRVDPQVIAAINTATAVDGFNAVGVMEFFSITAAVYAADAAAKAAEVTLMDVRLGLGIGGKSYVNLTGEVAAVRASVDAGVKEAEKRGFVVQSVVIPNPRKEIFESLM